MRLLGEGGHADRPRPSLPRRERCAPGGRCGPGAGADGGQRGEGTRRGEQCWAHMGRGHMGRRQLRPPFAPHSPSVSRLCQLRSSAGAQPPCACPALPQVRPYLMADGGNVEFVEIDGPVVMLRCGAAASLGPMRAARDSSTWLASAHPWLGSHPTPPDATAPRHCVRAQAAGRVRVLPQLDDHDDHGHQAPPDGEDPGEHILALALPCSLLIACPCSPTSALRLA